MGPGTSAAEAPGSGQRATDEHQRQSPGPGRASRAAGLTSPDIGRWNTIHWILLLVALVVLVLAGRGQHFFYDEWAFLGGKRDALPLPDLYLLPHNEHWSTMPLLAFRTLRATAGVGSYWPYLGLLVVLHLGVTHVLWRLMLITGSKPVVATSLAAVFSVFGAAAENLVWAFQIGFVGSTLLGVMAVYLAVTGQANWGRAGILAALTLVNLATSGVGLAYLVVVPLVYAWRRPRQAIVVCCVPLLVYVAWSAQYGHSLTHAPGASATLPLMAGAFVISGLTSALTGYFGFGHDLIPLLAVGVPILAGLAVAGRGWVAGRTMIGRVLLAMCGGAVVFFGIAGLARAGLGLGTAASPRYAYVAMSLLLPAIALLISRGSDLHRWVARAVVPLSVAIALSNIFQLFTFADQVRQANDASRRALVAASELMTGKAPIFPGQLPEPRLAPDLSTADLETGALAPAFEGVSPRRSDRLTASFNLQVRVAPAGLGAGTPMCRPAHEQRLSIPTTARTMRRFTVSTNAVVAFTLHAGGSRSAQQLLSLTRGAYTVSSLRDAGDLTIESRSPGSVLGRC